MDRELRQPGVFTRQCFAEHLGLGYIASQLVKEGHEVKLMYQDSSPSVFARKLIDTKPDILCATSMTYTHPLTRDILSLVKSELPKVKTILGGDHVSGWPKSADDIAINYIVLGEGEDTTTDLVREIEKGVKIIEDKGNIDIPGIGYYKEGEGVILTSPRERRTNLDELPFPFRTEELLDNTAFYSVMDPPSSKIKRLGAVIYSRGCPFNCDQCGSKNTLGLKTRWRTAKNVVDEMQDLRDRFGINALVFYDLTFNLRKDKVLELCKEIKSRELQKDIHWYTIVRIADNLGRPLLDREMLQEMYDAGCRKIGYGIESFDEGLQGSYNKSIAKNLMEDILQTADEIGILNRGFMMLSPYETRASLDAAKDMLRKLPLYEIRFSCLTPYPGTPFYEQCKQRGIILSDDFSRYTSDEIILKPSTFTIQELYDARWNVCKDFINSPEYRARVRKKIRQNPNFEQGFREYFDRLKKEGIMNWSL